MGRSPVCASLAHDAARSARGVLRARAVARLEAAH
jgi:hypothetical protein